MDSKIPTPLLPQSLFRDDFQQVYEPAEDSFLLLDALEDDIDAIKQTTTTCLECGSGSGVIITALAKSIGMKPGTLFIATDLNPKACKTTRKCSSYNGQNDILVVQTDLTNGLAPRLESNVDLIIFNPPYVPTDERELEIQHGQNQISLSWAGGQIGRNITDRFLKIHVPMLLSKPHGRVYIVALDRNDIKDLSAILLVDFGIIGQVVKERTCGRERLYIIRYTWK